MGHWTKHTSPINFERRASPTTMNQRYAPLVFTGASGEAVSNSDWNYEDANGLALFNAGLDLRSWTQDGAGSVREMTQPEKDAVDASIAAQNVLDAQSAAVAKVDIPATTGDEIPLEIRALINNANKRINYLTNRVEELFATMDTLLNGAGNASTRLNRIPPLHPNQSTQNPLTLPPNFSLIQTRGQGAAVQEYKDQINAGEADS